MYKILLKAALIVFLLFHFFISFKRYTGFALDGDMAPIILPSPAYKEVLQDPFGIRVLMHNSVYPATNRFFTHYFFSKYFKYVPNALQAWFTPLDSVYIASALFKIAVHVFLLFILSTYISQSKNFWSYSNLLAAAVISPLFLVYGYYMEMAIIDQSVTYTFFYAFAICFMLILFYLLYKNYMQEISQKINISVFWFLLPVIVINAFSGALNAPVTLLLCTVILFNKVYFNYKQHQQTNILTRVINAARQTNRTALIILLSSMLFCFYSYYISKNNSENLWEKPPLTQLYSKLFEGITNHYTKHLGVPLLLLVVIFNFMIMAYNNPDKKGEKLIFLFKWFIALTALYILLLPFGGYRSYRPLLIRYDTLMPVNTGMILFYGLSVIYLLQHFKKPKQLYAYILFIIGVSVVYINADQNFKVNTYNDCEKRNINKIAESQSSVVNIPADCTVMEWNIITESHKSRYITDMLLHWNITREKKLFYQTQLP